ncbi:unnamed protein product, partial [Choristocarpus tenellus]
KQGIIQPSSSPWGSLVTIVTKPDGSPRFCVDFRLSLNKNLVRNPWPLPSMEDSLGTVEGEKYLSCLDVQSACWQQTTHHQCQQTPKNCLCHTGWKTRIQNATLCMGLLICLDDIVLASPTWNHHIQLLESVLSLLQQIGVTLKPSKAQFGSNPIHYLGHEVSPSGIAVSPDRTQAIAALKAPKSVKELQSFLGSINFIRKYIPHLATITKPLVSFTRKSTETSGRDKSLSQLCGRPHQNSFNMCKHILTMWPVLCFPDFTREFFIHVDASDFGMGAFLAHKNEDDSFQIVAYHS